MPRPMPLDPPVTSACFPLSDIVCLLSCSGPSEDGDHTTVADRAQGRRLRPGGEVAMRFQQRVVIVTGAARGIGAVPAQAFARGGAVRVTSHYAAAKAGVVGFTRHLALEVGPDGVTVNAVAPGTTATERVRALRTPEESRQLAQTIPVRRLGEPMEIAEAILFLACDAASFVNGATLDVNGGQVMA